MKIKFIKNNQPNRDIIYLDFQGRVVRRASNARMTSGFIPITYRATSTGNVTITSRNSRRAVTVSRLMRATASS